MNSNILLRAPLSTFLRPSISSSNPCIALLTSRKPIANSTNAKPTTLYKHFSTTRAIMGVHNLAAKGDFDTALSEKGTLMVLDCFATWCGPCKVIAPKVVEFSEKYDKARFYKIDVDEVPDVAQELKIRAMPTFLLFKDGEKVGEVVGANPKALETAIEQNYKSE